MTESLERLATPCSATRAPTPRFLWRRQKERARASWREQHPRVGSLTFTGREMPRGNRYLFEAVCECGEVVWRAWGDLKRNVERGDGACLSCARRAAAAGYIAKPEGRAHQARMVAAAAMRGRRKWSAEEKRVARVMSEAQQRCTNPNNAGWENYGGRGIEFRFDSVESAVRWVVAHVGLPPPGCSIDRVDNDGHYAPGNLRWATREEQSRNRRTRRDATVLLPLARELRPDLSDSQLRALITRGLPMRDIVRWKKYRGLQ